MYKMFLKKFNLKYFNEKYFLEIIVLLEETIVGQSDIVRDIVLC